MPKLNKNAILTTSVAIGVVIILIISVYFLFTIRMAGKNMTSIYDDRVLPLLQLKEVSDAYNNNLNAVHKTIYGMINPDSALTVLSFSSHQIASGWNDYLKTYLTPEEKQLIQHTLVLKLEVDVLFSRIATILNMSNRSSKDSLLQQIVAHELYQKTESLESYINKLVVLQTKESGILKSLTESIFVRITYLVFFVTGMCILVSWLIAYKHRLENLVIRQTRDLEKQNDALNTAYEELQTTNEELDVVNEELYTTNEELAAVNEQLLDSNQGLETLVNERTHDLEESEKQYRYIVDRSPVGIFQRTLDGNYTFFNQALVNIFECDTLKSFLERYGEISKRWYEPDKLLQFRNLLLENNEVNGFELQSQLIDGRFKWLSLSASFDSETSLLNGFVQDITQEKLKEISIRETEAKIRAIFDLSYGFIGLLTPEGNIVEANNTSLEFAGISYDDVIGKPFWETPWWNHSRDTQKQIINAVKLAAKGETVRFETTHPGKNGINIIVDFSIKPVKDEKGNIIWLIPEGRDITERKLSEIYLKESQIKLSSIINSTTDMIWAVEPVTFKIIMFNVALEKYYNEQGLNISVGMDPEHLLLPPYDEVWNEFYRRALREEHFEEEYKTVAMHQYLYLRFNLLINDGKVFGISVFAHNITGRKLAEEKLRLSESIMERQILNSVIETEERERMNFSQELHDGLGPLLSAAKMYVQLLGKPKTKLIRDDIMKDIEKLLEESSKTVREISFKLSPHILQNYGLPEALKAFAEKIKETSPIAYKIEYGEMKRFNDKMEIIVYRIICECITNTIKHAQADRIYIKMDLTSNSLAVDYHDNGKGFDVDNVSLTGIGLLNIKSRIKSLNGSMSIISLPEDGTTISFKINTNVT